MLKDHLEKLNHFLGCARAGSIRRYAVENRLSQPAISKCIRILESELEAGLFTRGREGVALTKPGQDLFEFAEAIIARAETLDKKIREYGKLKVSGTLTMGTYESIFVYLVPTFLKFIRAEQDDLNLNFFSGRSAELVSALNAGKVDFIVSIDPPRKRDLHQVTIFRDTYSLYRPVGYDLPISRSLIFTLATASDENGKELLEYLRESGLDGRMSNCGDFESVKAMVEQGAGYAVLPNRVAAPGREAKKIEPATEWKKLQKFGEHQMVFSCRKHRADEAAIRWVLEQIKLILRKTEDARTPRSESP